MNKAIRVIFLLLLVVKLCAVSADDSDHSSIVSPISQIQAPDNSLPAGVEYQKGLFGEIISKMFRSDNKKIATAFLHPFHLLMQGSNTGRIPVWDSSAGNNWLIP